MKTKFGLFSLLSKLGKDEHASILVQATLYIVVLLGMTGLALDGGRFLLLNNSLQDLADAAALAGAAKLDGTTGATTQATNAAQAIANNNPPVPWYYDKGGSTNIGTPLYYTSLNPDTPTNGQATDANAHYIKVTTKSSEAAPLFVSAVGVITKTALSNNSTTATATAVHNLTACGPIQAYICAGNIPSGTKPGQQFLLLTGGSGGSGNWGILDLPSGVKDYTAYFAETPSSTCSTITGLHQSPGNGNNNGSNGSPVDGINVWFDHSQGTGDLSTAAPNVIDGFGVCQVENNTPSLDPNYDDKKNQYTGSYCGGGSCMLPRDAAIIDWTNPTSNPGSGASTTDLQKYWNNHHGGTPITNPLPSGVVSRYTMYQCELGVGSVAGCPSSLTWTTDSLEKHAPICSTTVANYKRRIIHVGVVPQSSCPNGNLPGDLTVTGNADFFITEDAFLSSSGNGGQPVLYGEYIGSYLANSPGGIIHQIVQLVR